MSSFSEYLSDYIESKDLSWKKAAMLCDIDRSLLRRYAKGENSPKNEIRVRAIADGLAMTELQKEELCKLYRREKVGESPYRGQRLLEQIFNGEYRVHAKYYTYAQAYGEQKQCWEQKQVKRLEGEDSLINSICYLIEDAEQVCFQMNPSSENEKVLSILAGVNSQCKLEQIIEVNNTGNGEEELSAFAKLLPLLLAGRDYKIFCHYKWKKEIQKESLQMGMLLTNKGLLLFDGTLTHGVYANEDGYKEYYREMFEMECNKCTLFAGSLKEDSLLLKEQQEQYQIENTISKDLTTFTYTADEQGEVIWIKRMGKVVSNCYITEVQLVEMFKKYMDIVSKKQAE